MPIEGTSSSIEAVRTVEEAFLAYCGSKKHSTDVIKSLFGTTATCRASRVKV
jgi:hypothetical protein